MSSSSFLTEVFDSGHWPMRSLYSTSSGTHCWLDIGLIYFSSHSHCCILWLPTLYACVARIAFSFPRIWWPVTRARWLNDYEGYMFDCCRVCGTIHRLLIMSFPSHPPHKIFVIFLSFNLVQLSFFSLNQLLWVQFISFLT